MRTLVTFDEALAIIRENVRRLGPEEVRLEHAPGRVLASEIFAAEDLPGFDNSSMDGYALPLRAEQDPSRREFRVAGEAAAGRPFVGNIAGGEAVRIMTGAPIPHGCGSVIEVERVSEKDGTIAVEEIPASGRNIRKTGEDLHKGESVMRAGTRVTAAHMGVLSALGYEAVSVSRVPNVSVVTTGSELVAVGGTLQHGQIRNSSAYMIPAMVREAHGAVDMVRTVSDEEPLLAESLSGALTADMLITTGGVSVGKYDLVIKALESVGVEFLFWKVNIKPGMPVAFGLTPQRRPVICLPGNPVSTAVTFLQFVRPALEAMQGLDPSERPRLRAVLEHEVHKKDSKRHFSRGFVAYGDGRWTVRTTGSQSSGILSSMVRANCLVILLEAPHRFAAGEEVEVELL